MYTLYIQVWWCYMSYHIPLAPPCPPWGSGLCNQTIYTVQTYPHVRTQRDYIGIVRGVYWIAIPAYIYHLFLYYTCTRKHFLVRRVVTSWLAPYHLIQVDPPRSLITRALTTTTRFQLIFMQVRGSVLVEEFGPFTSSPPPPLSPLLDRYTSRLNLLLPPPPWL